MSAGLTVTDERRHLISPSLGTAESYVTYTTVIMQPSSLGGGRILRRTLSVRLSVSPSVRPSRYRYRASRRAT